MELEMELEAEEKECYTKEHVENCMNEWEEKLTENQVENWTVSDLEVFLTTFIPTDEESTWLRNATKNIHCAAESEIMPFLKEIVKKRLQK